MTRRGPSLQAVTDTSRQASITRSGAGSTTAIGDIFNREYQPPGKDGLGARFIFPRLVDGQPFITADSGEVLFHADLSGGSGLNSTITNSDIPNRDTSASPGRVASPLEIGFTLNTRYKVKNTMFYGKHEY